jgi:hypothetical protein
MAIKKYTCPPQTPSGAGTFSDNLVGFQLVQGGGLTQGNFEFTEGVTEKVNRNFTTGAFSDPINLEGLNIESVTQSRLIIENNFRVYPNFDLTQVSNFSLYGSMVKRMEASIQTIISYFPAALEMTFMGFNYVNGPTAQNITYNSTINQTTFDLDISRLRNPFELDFTINATRNLSLKEIPVSPLRDLPLQYSKYSLYYNGVGYQLASIVPTNSLTTGTLTISVYGEPFPNTTFVTDNLVIRPNDYEVNKVFNEEFDEVENFLLNRNVTPKYSASFQTPKESDDGTYYIATDTLTWPINAIWNLDILTGNFTNYLTSLNAISESFDGYKTNLVSRFLVTGAFKDFDTIGQKTEKVLQIYGRSFDETRKYITALAFMNSVHYNTGNDIPSQLLKNLAQTLGWNINISPITNDDFLSSVFGQKNNQKSLYTGISEAPTPDALNYQYYKNLILNAAYLFKSKGTRKSIETLLRLIGAPEALVEFNEYIYLADQRINLSQFGEQFASISGGTYIEETPILEPGNIFSIFGIQYTGFTTSETIFDVNIGRDEYPMDEQGFPRPPLNSENYFFQIGSGWFEQTPEHRAPQEVDLTNSVFTGSNPNYQTKLIPYTYGQIYLERFRKFPFMNLGYDLRPVVDNKKSWTDLNIGLRSNSDGVFDSRYFLSDDKLVLNVKNVDIFMNPAQGLAYDVWFMSRQFNYPIPNYGLSYVPPTYCDKNPVIEYPHRGGIDWTEINPKPKRKTFFEFAQTFWQNMINVRDRLYINNGKTGGYPTLESIYWKYLQSEEIAGIQNNNFTYQTMIDYVNGMGEYWVRLIEQMVPATTIWNTGVKYENSIFHRQKFVWRRQTGCEIVPINERYGGGGNEGEFNPLFTSGRFGDFPCQPCVSTTNLYPLSCPTQVVECSKYPWDSNPSVISFGSLLGYMLNNYLVSNGLELFNCDLNSLTTEWFIVIEINNSVLVSLPFFNGLGYSIPNLSVPNDTTWVTSLMNALDTLNNFGYDYYLTDNDTIVIFNSVCSTSDYGINFKLSVGINFNLYCL